MRKKKGKVIPLFGKARPYQAESIQERRRKYRKKIEDQDRKFFDRIDRILGRNKKDRE
ncbi:hypothetical protein [Brevibacillus marinus]|uniref:hypothetical protein n=1 Tax=Brevibacillus marinus TaxID=2496837 RepID=UPI0013DF9DC0|nr:hypothetical protein [Brevibacillus marinus]